MDLNQEDCRPIRKGDPALDPGTVDALKAQVPDWTLAPDGKALERDFAGFHDYPAGAAFAAAVAAMAQAQNHHPDILLGYRHVTVHWSTHAVDGLSRNDFICAARTDKLPR